MSCPEFERSILDYLDNQLPSHERARVDRHLAACEECRAFRTRARQLDAVLSRAVKTPVLSAGFSARVWQALESGDTLGSAERAERKRRFEADYQARSAQLRRNSLKMIGLLDAAGYALLAVMGLYLAYHWVQGLGPILPSPALKNLTSSLLLAWLASTAVVLAGLRVAFKRPALLRWE